MLLYLYIICVTITFTKMRERPVRQYYTVNPHTISGLLSESSLAAFSFCWHLNTGRALQDSLANSLPSNWHQWVPQRRHMPKYNLRNNKKEFPATFHLLEALYPVSHASFSYVSLLFFRIRTKCFLLCLLECSKKRTDMGDLFISGFKQVLLVVIEFHLNVQPNLTSSYRYLCMGL